MIEDLNENWLRTFRTRSQARMSAAEKEQFDKVVGYSEDMSQKAMVDLYNDIFSWYDIEMDEMDEDECEVMMYTRENVLRHMRRDWFNVK